MNPAAMVWHFFAPGDREGVPSTFIFEILFGLMTFGWHGMRRRPEAVRLGATWLPGAAAAALLMRIAVGNIDLIQWISWSLPASTAAAIAVECAVLALLFLSIDRLFRKPEFTDRPARGSA